MKSRVLVPISCFLLLFVVVALGIQQDIRPSRSTSTNHPRRRAPPHSAEEVWACEEFLSVPAATQTDFTSPASWPIPFMLWAPSGSSLQGWPSLWDRCSNRSIVSVPLLVFLHGAGEVGDDLDTLRTAQGAGGTIPRLLHNAQDSGGDPLDAHFSSRQAHPLLNGEFPVMVVSPQTASGWAKSEVEKVVALVQRLQARTVLVASQIALRVDPKKVYVTGASMGGHAVLAYGALKSAAALVPTCGFVQGLPLDNIARTLQLHPSSGIMLFHGANDVMVPSFHSDDAVNQLRAANIVVDVVAVPEGGYPTQEAAYNRSVYMRFMKALGTTDGNPAAEGHGVFRQAYAAGSPLWPWLKKRSL